MTTEEDVFLRPRTGCRVMLVTVAPWDELITDMAPHFHLWIADTPMHRKLKRRLKAAGHEATWFPVHDGESLFDGAWRTAFEVDKRYNELALAAPYDSLWVLGTPYSQACRLPLDALGFDLAMPVWNGFIALRPAVPSRRAGYWNVESEKGV